MPAIDADALVALHQSTHPHHQQAVRLFEAADQVFLHPSVLTEFTTVLRRQANRQGLDGNQAARQTLRQLLAQPRVRLAAINHEEAVTRYLARPGLSFTDAVVAQFRSHHDQADPITFDKEILKGA